MTISRNDRFRVGALALLSGLGCQAAPFDAETGVGDSSAVVVRLLDEHFVQVAGSRVPWQELVYDTRVECRARRRAGESMPWVELRVPHDAAIPRSSVERIQAGLRQAGVRRIEMRIEGA